MFDANIVDRVWWVEALQIEAPDFKRDLSKVAAAIDDAFATATTRDIAPSIRLAFEELSNHVYFHCLGELEDAGSATDADKANTQFNLFEKEVGIEHGPNVRLHLAGLRRIFQATGNLAVHPEHLTAKDVMQAFNRIAEYAALWIVQYAPLAHRKSAALRDPHLDAIADYRKRAEARLAELMGGAPPECYLPRKVSFQGVQGKDEVDPDDDPFGWEAAKREQNARDDALLGKRDTYEPLKTHHRSLLLAQAGMGKSLEAAHLAVHLTCTKEGEPMSCCVVLDCQDVQKPATSVEGELATSLAESKIFRTFCRLRQWRRYLILDGFDELDTRRWTLEDFHRAIATFQERHRDVHILITSRAVTAVSSTFHRSWKAYELLELDEHSVSDYLIARLPQERELLLDVGRQWDQLDKHHNVRRLLLRPFFLSAFAETLTEGERIGSIRRRQLVERFILELLSRQAAKVDQQLTDDQLRRSWRALECHAFLVVTRQVASTPIAVYLAGLDLLLRSDHQFKQAEIRDYLAARYVFQNESGKGFDSLRPLEDEQRFAVHGWLLEIVNAEITNLVNGDLDPQNKSWVLDRLWRDDPVLVALGLFSEERLRSLILPARPWEPYEVGLLKIMRGDDAGEIPETSEIRDVKLSSPGEKLLHRLSHRDLPYLIRAVPGGRAVARLEAAWAGVADPWAELMLPLAPIARRWLEGRPSQSPEVSVLAYGVLKWRATVEQVTTSAKAAAANRNAESEMLVRLLLLLFDLRAQVGAAPNSIQVINDAITVLRLVVFGRPLSAKQLQRVLAKGTRRNDSSAQPPDLSQKILRLIYDGDVHEQARLESVRIKSLIMEIPALAGLRVDSQFVKDLWALVCTDVASVPPIALANALRMWIANPPLPESAAWFVRWLDHWLEGLNPYEAVRLQQWGFPFTATPPGFLDAEGWLQARDAVALKRPKRNVAPESALPVHQYEPEQKRHWLAAATLHELVGLLQDGVIDRSADDDVFQQAMRRLEEDSHPQHWWHLVREGKVRWEDIPRTAAQLADLVKSKPVAYELLHSVGRAEEVPSASVVDSAARCVDCPLDTRVHLVRRGTVSVDDCWKAEVAYLSEIRRVIAAGDPVKGLNGVNVPRFGGGLLSGFYTLIFCRSSTNFEDIRLFHPAFDIAIEFRNPQSRTKIARASRRWLDGELVMGFLWLTPAPDVPERTLTVTHHRMNYQAIGYVVSFRDGKPLFDPRRTGSKES